MSWKGVDSITASGIETLEKEMTLSLSSLKELSVHFTEEMRKGLAKEETSLKMLPAFLSKPTGDEKGVFVALDFGGTNVRILLVELLGNGNHKLVDRLSFPLKNIEEGYDYTAPSAKKEELFAYISRKIQPLIDRKKTYRLGHTFSFPCENKGLNQAFLIKWTKEIETSGFEGQDIGLALCKALKNENIENVVPVAIINDTVGTLLTGAYQEKDCDIATILGTGHNTCYVERNNPWSQLPMIINIESGNFDQVTRTRYDNLLDESSERPGEQVLEKMVSGKYLGEFARLILIELNKKGEIFSNNDLIELLKTGILTTADISFALAAKQRGLSDIAKMFKERFCFESISDNDILLYQTVCRHVRDRSARLAAATYLGVLQHIDPLLKDHHVIAVDGTLYEKLDGYSDRLIDTLHELLEDKCNMVKLRLVKDGSGVGAAIGAAMAE